MQPPLRHTAAREGPPRRVVGRAREALDAANERGTAQTHAYKVWLADADADAYEVVEVCATSRFIATARG